MLQVLQIGSLEELRSLSAPWDHLWRQSDMTLPTGRAELVAQWIEQFAPQARFRALVIEQDGQWRAALPLIEGRVAPLMHGGCLPTNAWSAGGDLLWDAAANSGEEIADALVEVVRGLPWGLLRIEGPALSRLGWRVLAAALDARGVPWHCRPQWQVAWIDTSGEWEAYQHTWSKKHREGIGGDLRALGRRGDVQLQVHSHLTGDDVEPLLHRAFEIEDRGWKGRAGSSVLRNPGIFDFFLRQARQLAEWGQMELSFLKCGDEPIAFAYGPAAKGVFHSFKIGYDPAYADYSPGQLLKFLMLQRFFADAEYKAMDCMGPLTAAHASWRPKSYSVSRLIFAPGNWFSRTVVRCCRCDF